MTDDPGRGTGRTTMMLKAAMEAGHPDLPVYIVAANLAHSRNLQAMWRSLGGKSDAVIWITLPLRSGPPNDRLWFDHYTLEIMAQKQD